MKGVPEDELISGRAKRVKRAQVTRPLISAYLRKFHGRDYKWTRSYVNRRAPTRRTLIYSGN